MMNIMQLFKPIKKAEQQNTTLVDMFNNKSFKYQVSFLNSAYVVSNKNTNFIVQKYSPEGFKSLLNMVNGVEYSDDLLDFLNMSPQTASLKIEQLQEEFKTMYNSIFPEVTKEEWKDIYELVVFWENNPQHEQELVVGVNDALIPLLNRLKDITIQRWYVRAIVEYEKEYLLQCRKMFKVMKQIQGRENGGMGNGCSINY